jgi:hypothetical protein
LAGRKDVVAVVEKEIAQTNDKKTFMDPPK